MWTWLFDLALLGGVLGLLHYAAGTRDLGLFDPLVTWHMPTEYPDPPATPTLVDARETYLGYQDEDSATADLMRTYVGRPTLDAILDEDLTILHIDWELGNRPPGAWEETSAAGIIACAVERSATAPEIRRQARGPRSRR